MTTLNETLQLVENTLLATPRIPAGQAARELPSCPGLYALYIDEVGRADLGLPDPFGQAPVYVGKAESSLRDRDGRTHFTPGKTGQSTVRRTLAALLRDRLGLQAMPRNPANPGHFSNYGLTATSELALQAWLERRVAVAVWTGPSAMALVELERALISSWRPCLNLQGHPAPWPALQVARKRMASDARGWSAP